MPAQVAGNSHRRERRARPAADARRARAQERFLHWQTAFPTVWRGGSGGFDAVIGNPPWDRMKLQEVEWFAERTPEIAMQPSAADRKQLIAELEKEGDPLWQEFLAAQRSAEMQTARGARQRRLSAAV